MIDRINIYIQNIQSKKSLLLLLRSIRASFNAIYFLCQINFSLINLFYDHWGDLSKGSFNVLTCFGWALDEHEFILLGKVEALPVRYFLSKCDSNYLSWRSDLFATRTLKAWLFILTSSNHPLMLIKESRFVQS